MTVVHYTNSLSAHQLPLDYELVRIVGAGNFRYIYTNERLQGGAQEVACEEDWVWEYSRGERGERVEEIKRWLENCDLLIVGGIRPIDLMEKRLSAGKMVFYMSERWFKPIPLFNLQLSTFDLALPGWLRLFHPRYFRMARRFVRLFSSPHYRYLPIGPWAARDMRLLMRVMRFLVREKCSGRVEFLPWGDFVEPSKWAKDSNADTAVRPSPRDKNTKVLWLGRMLALKHVETIVRAVAWANRQVGESGHGRHRKFTLTLVGDGPEKFRLQKSAAAFLPPVPLSEVRSLMRRHDLFVFASNAYEGWGAVVPEALTEGMDVIGTYEAGASAALLPKENLFHCGDWRELGRMLADRTYVHVELPYDYTPKGAAERLLRAAEKFDRISVK